MPVISPEGTIYGADGKVLHFSIQRWVRDVVQGGCCFMCGRAKSAKVAFSREHVVPNWILRRFVMHNQSITLPFGRDVKYGQYTVPCCLDCNKALGRHVEEPIRKMLAGGFSEVAKRHTPAFGKLLFHWMALLFIKTHLRDLQHRWHHGASVPALKIGDTYDWRDLHHIHCMARLPLLKTELLPVVPGSTIMVAGSLGDFSQRWDYADVTDARTMMVQVEDIVIFCVLNDSRMCEVDTRHWFGRLGRLSFIQAREVLAKLAYTNMLIRDRPRYRTELGSSGRLRVNADLPATISKFEDVKEDYGLLLDNLISSLPVAVNRDEVRTGMWTSVWRDDGTFATESVHRAPAVET